MNDGFRVAVGAVLMAAGNQLLAQCAVVINFAVEDDPKRTVLVRNGLVACLQVDNAEAAHADPGSAIGVEAVVVRPAMRHGMAHFAQRRRTGPRVAPEFKNAGDAAHLVFLRVRRSWMRNGRGTMQTRY